MSLEIIEWFLFLSTSHQGLESKRHEYDVMVQFRLKKGCFVLRSTFLVPKPFVSPSNPKVKKGYKIGLSKFV